MKMIQLDDAVVKGSSNISLNKVKDDEGIYPLYSAKGFHKNISFFHQEEEYLAIIKDGAGIGRISIHPPKSSCVGTMQYLIPKEGFDIRFIRYCLLSIDFTKYSQGATIPHIYFKDYKSELIPKLSIQEQLKLVSKLDQAFELIDQAIANTEKNIENVDELFQSQLDFLFSSKDDSWSTNVLSEIATLKYGYTEKSVDTGHYRYIRITDIDKQGKLRTETKQYLAYSPEAEEYLLKHNDLLMARTGATYGKVLLYDNIEPSVYASYLIRIDFNIPIDNEVYWFFSKSKSYWKQASQLSSGSAQPQFNGNALKKVSFSYPRHKDDQDILKEKCRAIFELTENLKQQYTAKLNELKSLKMSVLEEAFKGELV